MAVCSPGSRAQSRSSHPLQHISTISTPKPSSSRGSFLCDRSLSQHVLPTCHPQPRPFFISLHQPEPLHLLPAGSVDELSALPQVRASGQSRAARADCVQLMRRWPSTKHISLTSTCWVLARARDGTQSLAPPPSDLNAS